MSDSPPKPRRFVVTAEQAGRRIDQILADAFAISRGEARRALLAGGVYVNRKRIRVASRTLAAGAAIEAHLREGPRDSSGASGAGDRAAQNKSASALGTPALPRVLFEDAHLLVIDKPPGLPTQPTLDNARFTAFEAAKQIERERAQREGRPLHEVYVGLHHRLDRDTSGVLLFTRAKSGNAGIARAFQDRLAHKTYLALVAPLAGAKPLSKTFRVENFLKMRKLPGKKTRVESVRSGGDAAMTEFKVLQELNGVLLIEASPHTGRMHQIRVHLSELGYPLLGDPAYGGATQWRGRPVPRCMLHAAKLTLPHPVSGSPLTIESPLPPDFESVLQGLRVER